MLRPGGRLVAECGGQGNVAAVNAAISEFTGVRDDFEFADVTDTERRLAAAGFTDIDVGLRADPYRPPSQALLREYLATVVLGGYLDNLPPGRHDSFVDAVASRLDPPVIDYVRLEIAATRR